MKHLLIYLLIAIPLVWITTFALDDEVWLMIFGWWMLSFASFLADCCVPRKQ